MSLDKLKRPNPKGNQIPPQGGSSTAPPKSKAKADAPAKVTFQCGHSCSVGFFTGRACPECQSKLVKAKRARNLKKMMGRGAAGAAARHEDRGRLPDGAVFNVIYDANKKEWSGGLSIPDKGLRIFAGRNTALFKLLWELDEQYRKWAAEQSQEKDSPTVERDGQTG
jgi:hypothetical protein